MTTDLERLEKTLGSPHCSRLLARLRQRLENGEPIEGVVNLSDPTEEERAHIAAILGSPPSRGTTLRIDLRKLEACFRDGELCDSLNQGVEALCGPIPNRRAQREAHEEGWAKLFREIGDEITAKPELLSWLDEVRARGVLRRLAGNDLQTAARLLRAAVAVLLPLPVADIPLPRFAVDVLGDSHALDPDRAVTGLVLRALARRAGLTRWDDAENRRDAWAAAGVIADELSAPALALNLPALPTNTVGRQIRLLAETGEPVCLTVRQLLREPPRFEPGEGRTIFVCENPTVVAAATDLLGASCAPLVCIQGQLKTSARLLLKCLSEAGWELAYHGDFDWPGLQIANRIIERHRARPWRMSATDYRAVSPSSVPLTGFEVVASWDADLASEMKAVGYSLLEEQVLKQLCFDLQSAKNERKNGDGV